ncbi:MULTISPECIES: hypothetical protein [unclassified Clostridium]|uniref:hypothetical protein n=1 Tax=unclassified Clostridium TaxID=2614128 RepID=UPI0025C0F301|nr:MULTISPECIES: hypothetical protein [unclassified Clostridium]
MLKDKDIVIAQGVVTKIFPNDIYEVQLESNRTVKAMQSKELKNSLTKLRVSDKVLIKFCKCSVAPKAKIAKIFKIKK